MHNICFFPSAKLRNSGALPRVTIQVHLRTSCSSNTCSAKSLYIEFKCIIKFSTMRPTWSASTDSLFGCNVEETYLPPAHDGKVMFSVCLSVHGDTPVSGSRSLPCLWFISAFQGVPSLWSQALSWAGEGKGGKGYPSQVLGQGYPSPPLPPDSTRRGQCAFCGHTGGLSCYWFIQIFTRFMSMWLFLKLILVYSCQFFCERYPQFSKVK